MRYFKGYIKESVLAPLFKMMEALLELFVPLVVAAIIDKGIGLGDRAYIVKMCLLLVALGFIGLAFSITAQFFAAKAAVGFTAELRHALFERIGRLSYTELDRIGASTLVTRMTSDMNQVQSGINLTLRLLLRSPFVVFGAMIMAFYIDTPSAMIFVYVTAVLLIAVFGIMLGSIPLFRRVQQGLDKVTLITRENLSGVRVIRAFCREREETEAFTAANNGLVRRQTVSGAVSALMNPVTYIIINIGIICLISSGGKRVDSGNISQGDVVALYNYMSQILIELIKLANLIISVTKSAACAGRISAVLDGDEELPPSAQTDADVNESEYAVEFRNVSLRYKNASDDALSGITFRVKKGQTVGIIGGTGSGKTSLVNMIPAFYKARDGKVLVNGADASKTNVKELRKKIGIVPQKAILFKGTIRENMKWGNENASDEEIESALKAAQGYEVAVSKGGLDFEIEQGGRNLSGGQKQRFTIARAIVRRPEILILDDSASALDFATDAALRKSLRELDFEPTVFIVSQRTSSIQHADVIIVLDDGETAGIGTHSELLEGCQVYREIYNSQFKKEA